MGASPANFGGQQFYVPGAYSQRNFVSNEGGGVSVGNICILGYSELGEPQKLLVFDTADDARSELGSGEGLDGVLQAFEPGNDLVPQQVGFMRVNPGTQSARDFKLGAVSVFNAKSYSYGVPMNQVKAKLSEGTIPGTFKLETEYKGSTTSVDNIEKQSLSIQYVGSGSACLMTIDETKLTTVVTGGAPEDTLDITLSDLPSISELVEFINNNPAYDATILADNILDKSIEIDFATAQDIRTSSFDIKSDYQAIYEELNTSTYLTDVTKSGVIRTVPDVDADFVYLNGASSGTYTTQDFTDTLEEAEEEDIQLMSTTSTEASVHQLIKNHCVSMSSIQGRRERQFYVGGALNESPDQAIARAKALNSALGSLCYPGYKQFKDGEEYMYSPAFYACKQVGLISALPVNTPTTSKSPNILEWERTLKSGEIKNLIIGGVLCGGKDQKGNYITVRGVTTTSSSLIQEVQAEVQRETLVQDADLRLRIENAIVGTPGIGGSQLTRVDTVFARAISDWLNEGTIVAVDGKTSKGYTRSLSGDTIRISYGTWNTVGTNFVFITHNVLVPTA